MQTEGQECSKCRYFFSREKSGDSGTCRRYAPKPSMLIPKDADWAAWPPVRAKDVCGEFVPTAAPSSEPPPRSW